MSDNLTKQELVSKIAENVGLTKKQANEALDEALAASKPFVPSLPGPRLRGQAECAGWVGAGFLGAPTLTSTVKRVTLSSVRFHRDSACLRSI